MRKRKAVTGCILAVVMGICAVAGNVSADEVTAERSPEEIKIASIHEPIIDVSANEVSFSYIYFGNYPQSEVTGEALTEEIIEADYDSSGIISEITDIDGIINYAVSGEAVVMGEKYRRMAGEDGTYRYFKYEPVKWRVMSVNNGIAELRSDVALDSRPCLYEQRDIDDWLNSEIIGKATFLDFAFTKDEIRSLTTEIDIWKFSYLFTRKGLLTEASDYTWCRGVMKGDQSSKYVDWWVGYYVEYEVPYVNTKGELCDNYTFKDSGGDYNHYRYNWKEEGVGVCPVINLNLSNTDYWYTEKEIETIQEATSYEITDISNYKNDMQIHCSVPEDCRLMVACYDEKGKMEAYGTTELITGTTSAYISLQGTMEKETYLVKAFLLEENSNDPLCPAYIETFTDIGIKKQGKCGEDIFYKLDYNGKLELSGQGRMYDYTNFSYSNPVYSPFQFDSGIQTIVIGEGIESIGNYAFYNLTGLNAIQFSDSVVEIGKSSFEGCSKLEQVHLPDGLQVLGESAFESATSLKNVKLPEGLKTIGRRAFYGCETLESIYMPDTVTTMGNMVFGECVSLKNVHLSSGLTRFATDTFYFCNSLQTMKLPEGPTIMEKDVFCGCPNLKSVTLPKSLVSIEEYPFNKDLKDFIYVYEGSYAEEYLKSLGKEYFYADAGIQDEETVTFPAVETEKEPDIITGSAVENSDKTVVVKETEYRNLEAGKEYLLVVVKENKDDIFDSGNVLYINQYPADSKRMRLEYVLDETVTDYKVLLFSNSEELPVRVALAEEKGDVSQDGRVDLSDAQITLKASLKIIQLTEEEILRADIDEDGDVTLMDAQKVLRKALKIIE